jgi:hypothetical protein
MFPGLVRAMLLDGVVDPVKYSRGAEARVAGTVTPSDDIFDRFYRSVTVPGPERCALAGGRHTAAERVERLFARVRRAPIPAPAASPRGGLSYGDLLLSQFEPLRGPDLWRQDPQDLNAALGGDGSAPETDARKFLTPAGWSGATTSSAISCADSPARRGSRSWPRVIGAGSTGSAACRAAYRAGGCGPLRLLAGARPGQLPRPPGAPRPPT